MVDIGEHPWKFLILDDQVVIPAPSSLSCPPDPRAPAARARWPKPFAGGGVWARTCGSPFGRCPRPNWDPWISAPGALDGLGGLGFGFDAEMMGIGWTRMD